MTSLPSVRMRPMSNEMPECPKIRGAPALNKLHDSQSPSTRSAHHNLRPAEKRGFNALADS
jgi:hypothetical protein